MCKWSIGKVVFLTSETSCRGWMSGNPLLWVDIWKPPIMGGCLETPCHGWMSGNPLSWVDVWKPPVIGECLETPCHW